MKKVITYGTFDLFHKGHYNLLKRAKELGDYLIVGVTTEQYDEYRGKVNVVDSLIDRIEHIKQTGFADKIIVEDHIGQKIEDIQKYGVDIFTAGSDWIGHFEYLKNICNVVFLERTKGVSSTMLRAKNQKIIKIGIIGSGRIACRFIRDAKKVSGINIESVFNPNIKSAENFGKRFQLEKCTDDWSLFIAGVDAVYIASPHETHYEYIIKSLDSNKHVLCEKPMALKKSHAEEAFAFAKEKQLVLMEAIKTAYAPGFVKLLSISRIGSIGKIYDVEACFTKLSPEDLRKTQSRCRGSFLELASYPLLAIIKLLGVDYQDIRFETFKNEDGTDIYSKAYLKYNNSLATVKVGLGVKSEGQLIISGSEGYIIVESPWWKTQSFETRFENPANNEKFFIKYAGEGLTYEIIEFLAMINKSERNDFKLTAGESIAIAGIIERFIEEAL